MEDVLDWDVGFLTTNDGCQLRYATNSHPLEGLATEGDTAEFIDESENVEFELIKD